MTLKPGVGEELQSLKAKATQRATNHTNGGTTDQRALVKWTRILAYTTGPVAVATTVLRTRFDGACSNAGEFGARLNGGPHLRYVGHTGRLSKAG